jgi:hypothetical protein
MMSTPGLRVLPSSDAPEDLHSSLDILVIIIRVAEAHVVFVYSLSISELSALRGRQAHQDLFITIIAATTTTTTLIPPRQPDTS